MQLRSQTIVARDAGKIHEIHHHIRIDGNTLPSPRGHRSCKAIAHSQHICTTNTTCDWTWISALVRSPCMWHNKSRTLVCSLSRQGEDSISLSTPSRLLRNTTVSTSTCLFPLMKTVLNQIFWDDFFSWRKRSKIFFFCFKPLTQTMESCFAVSSESKLHWLCQLYSFVESV